MKRILQGWDLFLKLAEKKKRLLLLKKAREQNKPQRGNVILSQQNLKE